MKNIIIPFIAILFLAGCEGKEKTELVERLTNKFKADQDLIDYSIDPEEMANCVVGKILTQLPGFPGSPKRTKYIAAYLKLASVETPMDVKKSLDETTEVFGSMQKAHEAASSITEHNFSCVGDLVNANPETIRSQE